MLDQKQEVRKDLEQFLGDSLINRLRRIEAEAIYSIPNVDLENSEPIKFESMRKMMEDFNRRFQPARNIAIHLVRDLVYTTIVKHRRFPKKPRYKKRLIPNPLAPERGRAIQIHDAIFMRESDFESLPKREASALLAFSSGVKVFYPGVEPLESSRERKVSRKRG